MNVKNLVLELIAYSEEQEWFEFKENWYEPEALGEYIAALSNAAALLGKKYAYMICVMVMFLILFKQTKEIAW